MIKIAIAGNPNSGKTTVFNSLSGRNERVGNWAGVTVAKKEAFLKRRYSTIHEDILLVDLPGAYAMEAYTNDEHEATEFLLNENIDAIINVVDASNLERSLFFSSQLIETGIPVVIALNKSDITKRRKTRIDTEKLGQLLGAKVHLTQATCREGLADVVASAIDLVLEKGKHGQKQQKKRGHQRHRFPGRGKGCRRD
jgi:ferrous iron transport protein B